MRSTSPGRALRARRTGQGQRRPGRGRLLGTATALVLVAAACASSGDDDDATAEAAPIDDEEAVEEEIEPTGAIRETSEQGEPVQGGSITIGLEAETNSWLPGQANLAPAGDNVAIGTIYDPLMRWNADGEIQPYLAESMEANEDFTEWTLTLREGVTFHDGTPLDAEALKTIFDEYLRAEDSNLLSQVGPDVVEEMVIEDDLTVTYVMTAPNSAFPDTLTQAAGLPFSPTAAEELGDDAGSNPVGTGPFEFVSWERDSQLVVQRNDDYWQEGLPYLDEIVFRPIPDEDARVSSLESGDIDVAQSLRQSTIRRIRDLDGVDHYEHLGNDTGGNIINTIEPPFDDVRVRRALAQSIEQNNVIEILGGLGISPPSSQLFTPDSVFFSQAVADAWITDSPDEAAAELADYIADPDRSDRASPGEPVRFRYDCPPDPSLTELAQLYQANWQGVGFEVELRQVEQATHVDEALAGDYQVKCFRFGDDRDPAIELANQFGSESPVNWTNISDETIDENLAALRATDDVDERRALVEEISTIVNENAALTYSGGTLSTLASRDHVKNVDGWEFPDGESGGGLLTPPQNHALWGFAWTTE